MKTLTNAQLEPVNLDWAVYMERAIELASRVLTATPNPRVGCVLVRDGQIVGEGWHTAAGTPHAEINALNHAGESAAGATAFVTLEPCAHQGKTGPCSVALIQAGVTRVVIASVDPNPLVSGKGVVGLESAGIPVTLLKDSSATARQLNRGFFRRMESGLPYVTVKLAMSIDGRTALSDGASQWITGGAARSDVQRLRAGCSALLTGIETVLRDDPSLTVRPQEMSLTSEELKYNETSLSRAPVRVVLDSKNRTPGTAKLFASPGRVVVFSTPDAPDNNALPDSAELRTVPASGRRVELQSVLESLANEYQCNDLLIEAGPTLSGAFIESGLAQELVIYVGPKLLGTAALPLLAVDSPGELDAARQFDLIDVRQLGPDVRLTYRPVPAGGL